MGARPGSRTKSRFGSFGGDTLYIGTANVNHQWVRNVQKTPQMTASADLMLLSCAVSACWAEAGNREDLRIVSKITDRGDLFPMIC